jgi:ribulose-5-phosphate 4-epimerase/fuculose-1-phosphate aldolase
MMEAEGVIKYQLDYAVAPALAHEHLAELNAWRRILYLLNLVGQDPGRYDGFAYGNVSCRLAAGVSSDRDTSFLITGTQTNHLPQLGPEHYAVVERCDPDQNRIVAKGPVKPSSETLTHGTLYQLDSGIQYVMHVHSPEIWQSAARLNIPETGKDVVYGTPEMAQEIKRLFDQPQTSEKKIMAMAGHQDGIVAFGSTASQAGGTLINYLASALQLTQAQ